MKIILIYFFKKLVSVFVDPIMQIDYDEDIPLEFIEPQKVFKSNPDYLRFKKNFNFKKNKHHKKVNNPNVSFLTLMIDDDYKAFFHNINNFISRFIKKIKDDNLKKDSQSKNKIVEPSVVNINSDKKHKENRLFFDFYYHLILTWYRQKKFNVALGLALTGQRKTVHLQLIKNIKKENFLPCYAFNLIKNCESVYLITKFLKLFNYYAGCYKFKTTKKGILILYMHIFFFIEFIHNKIFFDFCLKNENSAINSIRAVIFFDLNDMENFKESLLALS